MGTGRLKLIGMIVKTAFSTLMGLYELTYALWIVQCPGNFPVVDGELPGQTESGVTAHLFG